MKDDYFILMSEEQRSFWNYKFKDKIKFEFANSIIYAIFLVMSVNIFFLSVAWLLQQDVLNEVVANSILQGVLPVCALILIAWLFEIIYEVIMFFIWNYRESEWIKNEVL